MAEGGAFKDRFANLPIEVLAESPEQILTNAPFCKVEIDGKSYGVRCASIADCAWVEQLTGMSVLRGDGLKINEVPTEKLVQIAERALMGQLKADAMLAMRPREYVKIGAACIAFLLAGLA